MVAHDAKTGKATKPTLVESDGSTPNDPQINAPDREPRAKPAASLSGYVRGGTTNPSAGESGEVAYFDADGKPAKAADVLAGAADQRTSRSGGSKATKREKDS